MRINDENRLLGWMPEITEIDNETYNHKTTENDNGSSIHYTTIFKLEDIVSNISKVKML